MIPFASGDRRDVRLIHAACGEQLHHERRRSRENRGGRRKKTEFGSVHFLSLSCAAPPFYMLQRWVQPQQDRSPSQRSPVHEKAQLNACVQSDMTLPPPKKHCLPPSNGSLRSAQFVVAHHAQRSFYQLWSPVSSSLCRWYTKFWHFITENRPYTRIPLFVLKVMSEVD